MCVVICIVFIIKCSYVQFTYYATPQSSYEQVLCLGINYILFTGICYKTVTVILEYTKFLYVKSFSPTYVARHFFDIKYWININCNTAVCIGKKMIILLNLHTHYSIVCMNTSWNCAYCGLSYLLC